MRSKVVRIIDGHIKEFTGQNEELFARRYEICERCPELKQSDIGEVCDVCGCRLQAKLRVEMERCPIGKWE